MWASARTGLFGTQAKALPLPALWLRQGEPGSVSSRTLRSLQFCCNSTPPTKFGVKVRATSPEFDQVFLSLFRAFVNSFHLEFAKREITRRITKIRKNESTKNLSKKCWSSWPSSVFSGVFSGLKLANFTRSCVVFERARCHPSRLVISVR